MWGGGVSLADSFMIRRKCFAASGLEAWGENRLGAVAGIEGVVSLAKGHMSTADQTFRGRATTERHNTVDASSFLRLFSKSMTQRATLTRHCPGSRLAETGRLLLERNRRLELQGIRFLHPSGTNRFCRHTQGEPDRDVEAADRKKEEARDEDELGDVVR